MVECDLVVKGSVAGVRRGWLRQADGSFLDDTGTGPALSDGELRALATVDAPLTYTCVPPGSGLRAGIDRDRDSLLDGSDNCPGSANLDQNDSDGDTRGNACDQDDDNDEVLDDYETNTGVFVSAFDTGTDPLLEDTDGDGQSDGLELTLGSDPTDPTSVPEPDRGVAQIAALLTVAALAARRRRHGLAARPCEPSANRFASTVES